MNGLETEIHGNFGRILSIFLYILGPRSQAQAPKRRQGARARPVAALGPRPGSRAMGVLESAVMSPDKALQIWGPQTIWLPQQELPRNSVPGAGLKEKMSLTLTKFPGSFLEIANLGQNVILYLCTLKHSKVRYL